MPSRSAGETAGKAARLAAIVISGTSWKWNSSSGVTPSCAASVVPAAIATAVGRNRPSRSASADASVTMPAVAATESWNPIACTSHGSSTINSSTAAASTEPAARGLPSRTPVSARPAIIPARSTDGSAPVSTTNRTTTPRPSPNRVDRPEPQAPRRTPRPARAPSPRSRPETTSRCPSPVVWKSRVVTGSRLARRRRAPGPRSRPASRGGKIRSIVRPTNARTICVSRTNGAGAPPIRVDLERTHADREATIGERLGEPGVLRQLAACPRYGAGRRARRPGTSSLPLTHTVSRTRGHAARATRLARRRRGRASRTGSLGVLAQRAGQGHRARREAVQERGPRSRLGEPRPADPAQRGCRRPGERSPPPARGAAPASRRRRRRSRGRRGARGPPAPRGLRRAGTARRATRRRASGSRGGPPPTTAPRRPRQAADPTGAGLPRTRPRRAALPSRA